MKNSFKILILSLLVFSCNEHSTKEHSTEYTYYESGQVKTEYNYNGINYEYYDNEVNFTDLDSLLYDKKIKGSIYKKFKRKEGKIDGSFLIYFQDGKIWKEQKFENGKSNGLFVVNFPNGNTRLTGVISNDKKEGPFYEYYGNGNLKRKVSYKNGKLEGLELVYWKNRNIKKKSNYNNNLLEGKSYKFWDNGDTLQINNYLEDKLHGKVIDISPFNNKRIEVEFLNGDILGKKYEYNLLNERICEIVISDSLKQYISLDGDIIFECEIDKDKKCNGKGRMLYSKGQIWDEGTYKNGKPIGIFTVYDKLGNIKGTCDHKDGKGIEGYGVEINRSLDGDIFIDGGFRNKDIKIGLWEVFDIHGNLINNYKIINNERIYDNSFNIKDGFSNEINKFVYLHNMYVDFRNISFGDENIKTETGTIIDGDVFFHIWDKKINF